MIAPRASGWQLEFVRLIAFSAGSVSIDHRWWQELTSELPSDSTPTLDRGGLKGALLSCAAQQQHIIWEVRSPSVASPSTGGQYPTLGAFKENLTWFIELMSRWLANSCPAIVRLALSAKLLQLAATQTEAYGMLAYHLPPIKSILDEQPNDFLLQINKRRDSVIVSGLEVNQVCTWSKMNLAVFSEPGKPFKWPEQCYSVLELDINTAPEKAAILEQETLAALFRKLAFFGEEIAEHRAGTSK